MLEIGVLPLPGWLVRDSLVLTYWSADPLLERQAFVNLRLKLLWLGDRNTRLYAKVSAACGEGRSLRS
jgi:hypothetical protein